MCIYYYIEIYFINIQIHVSIYFRKLNGNSLTTLKEGTFHGLNILKQL